MLLCCNTNMLTEGHRVARTEQIDSLQSITAEATAHFDLRPSADAVENLFADKLVDPPKGIYLIGQMQPAIIEGKRYFWRDDDGSLVLLEDINKVDRAIVDADGYCIISARYMQNKARMLANTPTLPYRGVMVVKCLVDHQINSFAAYHRRGSKQLEDALSKHFQPTVEIDADVIDTLEKCTRQLRNDLAEFLGEDAWRMFFTHLNNTTLRVERCMDWRAWEWEQQHGSDFRAGRYYSASVRDDDGVLAAAALVSSKHQS